MNNGRDEWSWSLDAHEELPQEWGPIWLIAGTQIIEIPMNQS